MDLQESNGLIENQETIHLEYIAYQTFDSQASQFGTSRHQPLAGPDQEVMSQGFQVDQYLLGCKAFLVAFRGCQALLILLDLDLDPTAALVIEVDIRQQDCLGIVDFLLIPAGQKQHILGSQGRKDYPITPLPIFLAAAYGNALDGTAVQIGGEPHPTHLATTVGWIGDP